MRWTHAIGVASLLGCVTISAAAYAAGPEFCRNYARESVEQSRLAREVPYCRQNAHGARWAMDWRVHFDWCRGADPRAAEDERRERRRYLHYCGALR